MAIEREYELLFKNNFDSLYYYAKQIVKDDELCRDIISDAFEIAWAKRDVTEPSRRLSFFYRMVHNRCVDHIRKEAARNRYAEFYRKMNMAGIANTEYDADTDIRKQQLVDEVMEELPPTTRTIIERCFMDNRHYAEVAEELGISLSSVKKHVAKALMLFRTRWRPDG